MKTVVLDDINFAAVEKLNTLYRIIYNLITPSVVKKVNIINPTLATKMNMHLPIIPLVNHVKRRIFLQLFFVFMNVSKTFLVTFVKLYITAKSTPYIRAEMNSKSVRLRYVIII